MEILSSPGFKQASPESKTARAWKAAREFEAIFSSFMLRSMRKTVGNGGLIERSMGENIYTDMLDQEYAGLLSRSGELGLAKQIMKELAAQDTGIDDLSALRQHSAASWMIDHRIAPQARQTLSAGDAQALFSRLSTWRRQILESSQTFDVDHNLVSAVMAAESADNPRALSSAGAKGLMQLIDSTAADMGVRNSYDPKQNITGGVRYLKQMLSRYDNNERLALAAYNAGPGAVDKYKGVPPYPETQRYVDKVLDLRRRFVSMNPEEPHHASTDR